MYIGVFSMSQTYTWGHEYMAINKCHVTISTRTDTKPCMEFKVQQMKSIRINSLSSFYCTSCQDLAPSPDLPHFFTTPFVSGKGLQNRGLYLAWMMSGGRGRGPILHYISVVQVFSSLQTFTYGSLPPYIHLMFTYIKHKPKLYSTFSISM